MISPYCSYHPAYHNCFTLVSAIHRFYEVFLFANMLLPYILFNIHMYSLYMHIFVSAQFPYNTLFLPYHLYNTPPPTPTTYHLYLYYFFLFLSFCCCLRFKNPSLYKNYFIKTISNVWLVIFRKLQAMATSGHHARKNHVIRMGAMWVVPQIVQVPN